jgi:phosphoglucomutase
MVCTSRLYTRSLTHANPKWLITQYPPSPRYRQVDGSVSKNQGVRFIFQSGSRIVFRLSGTGVAGATVRMYLEAYEPPSGDLNKHAFDVVKPLADIALKLSKLVEFTGRNEPTVIT